MRRTLPAVLLLLAAACGSPRPRRAQPFFPRPAPDQYVHEDEPMIPECSGGVCVFRAERERVRRLCCALYGQEADGCFIPELKAGWECAPLLSADVCRAAGSENDELACRRDLFGEP